MIWSVFRLVFIAFVLYLIYAVVRFFQSIGKSARLPNEQAPIQGTMVKDEFCNMYLPRTDAIREVRDGREYFFCSDECRKKFFEAKKR